MLAVLFAGAVHVALGQDAQHGVHHAVVGVDVVVVRVDGLRNKLHNTYFLYMRVVSEGHVDVLHVRASTGKDDTAQQPVGILGRNLIPHILDNLLKSALYDLDKLAALYAAVGIDGEHQGVVYLVVVSISISVFQLHLLGVLIVHLQRSDILGDVVAAERYDSKMAKNILIVNRNSGGIGTKVNEHAS